MLDRNTCEIIKEFNSIKQAAQYLLENKITSNKSCGARIIVICQNKGNTAYGYKWRYVDKGVSTISDECN